MLGVREGVAVSVAVGRGEGVMVPVSVGRRVGASVPVGAGLGVACFPGIEITLQPCSKRTSAIHSSTRLNIRQIITGD